MYQVSEKYRQICEAAIEEHSDLQWIPVMFRVGYLTSDRAKTTSGRDVFAECIKVSELYQALIPYDFLIVFYLPTIAGLTKEQIKILAYHELLHIDVTAKGESKIRPHDVEDFKEIINHYGMNWSR